MQCLFGHLQGIAPAIMHVFPRAQQRNCCRHIFANFKKKHASIIIREHFWKAARAYQKHVFEDHMKMIKDLSEEAWKWLDDLPKDAQWSRHMFDPAIKNDHITNNMAESYNAWIGELRGKPLVEMIDRIRSNHMSQIANRFTKGSSWDTVVTPNAMGKLNKRKKWAAKLSLIPAGQDMFEVRDHAYGHNGPKYVVRLGDNYCSCMQWQISGIPCKHVCRCIMYRRHKAEDYCDK